MPEAKIKTLSRKTIVRRRRDTWERIEGLKRQIQALQDEAHGLVKLCPHEPIHQYFNYEDSGWACSDCGGDWKNHPHKDTK